MAHLASTSSEALPLNDTSSRNGLRVAADIGGTFTDIALLTPDGHLSTGKLLSTPANYADAVVEGVTALSLVRRLDPERLEFPCFGHIIFIEGFGTIHLAEATVSKHERHVTMLRVDLGSPVVGTVDVAPGCVGGGSY